MRLLLLNTCGAAGSVALADTELSEPVVALAEMPGRSASERLVAAVREAMAAVSWKLADLAAVAVVTGPGSFTGVRVGLSVAKGLSEAGGVPLIAVSRLAMLAASGDSKQRICALLDAGRNEFYCGQYPGSPGAGEALLSRENALLAARQADEVLVCEQSVSDALGQEVALQLVPEPTAADALPIAWSRLKAAAFDDPETLDANYLRRTDAEIFAKPAMHTVG